VTINQTHRRHYCAAAVCLLLLQPGATLLAQNSTAPNQQETQTAPAKPASPALGKTTLAEAKAAWEANGATIVGSGKLAIGGGNGVDGMSQVQLDQVDLVDVTNIDFEGLPVARYAFVDGVLYAISSKLENDLSRNHGEFKVLTREEQESLARALTRKYGRPSRTAQNFYASGKRPNIFIWTRKDSELVLELRYGLGSTLSIRNTVLAKKVEAYTKAECKKHRPTQPGPITQVCV
jgi:hypothetical protein